MFDFFEKYNVSLKLVKFGTAFIFACFAFIFIFQFKLIRLQRDTYRDRAVAYEHQITGLIDRIKIEQESSEKAKHEIDEMIEVIKDDHKLVNDPRLEKLFEKKPGLIINRINDASERMRHELEDAVKN